MARASRWCSTSVGDRHGVARTPNPFRLRAYPIEDARDGTGRMCQWSSTLSSDISHLEPLFAMRRRWSYWPASAWWCACPPSSSAPSAESDHITGAVAGGTRTSAGLDDDGKMVVAVDPDTPGPALRSVGVEGERFRALEQPRQDHARFEPRQRGSDTMVDTAAEAEMQV